MEAFGVGCDREVYISKFSSCLFFDCDWFRVDIYCSVSIFLPLFCILAHEFAFGASGMGRYTSYEVVG